eukprot:EG_transcript_17976
MHTMLPLLNQWHDAGWAQGPILSDTATNVVAIMSYAPGTTQSNIDQIHHFIEAGRPDLPDDLKWEPAVCLQKGATAPRRNSVFRFATSWDYYAAAATSHSDGLMLCQVLYVSEIEIVADKRGTTVVCCNPGLQLWR